MPTTALGPKPDTRPDARSNPGRDTDHVRILLARLTGDEKHSPSAHSTLDVLWVLYDRILRVTPDTMDSPDRDRFLLSKGHGPAAYYAVLAAKASYPTTYSTTWAAGPVRSVTIPTGSGSPGSRSRPDHSAMVSRSRSGWRSACAPRA